MKKVFIVRPFGNREVLKKDKTGNSSSIKFDFNKVEEELIRPAMDQLDLTGGTTGEVFAAGDIREDMFSDLLLADIVIADITIYNANVFYELGIRHALRDKRTILIKCPGFDETPFDIIGYRYISYDKDRPADALPNLINAIDETMKTDRKDSPVFNILPNLQTQDPEKYLALPEDFISEVRLAEQTRSPGKLALLAFEAESFQWRLPALRRIGESLFKIKSFNAARMVWEKVIKEKPYSPQANDRLATIYQRLAEPEMDMNMAEGTALLVKSDMAIEILLKDNALTSNQKAEAYALKARNAKTRWINSWNKLVGDDRSITALQSINLENAFKYYEKGFMEDLNHFYSGINALGLLITIISLAEKNPGIWESAYDSSEEANLKLKGLKDKLKKLTTAVQVSIESAKLKEDAKVEPDFWVYITEADFVCLTSENPVRATNLYKKVLQGAGDLNVDAVVRQLKLYHALGVKTDNITSALTALPEADGQQKKTTHYILFTGHMIDKADRKEPRFPASKETSVREAIKEKIIEEKNKLAEGDSLIGIAGGACGGDILFHEVCEEIGIKTQMFLALPEDEFKVESVAFAGPVWIERFNRLFLKLSHPVLSANKELPKWLQNKKNYTIWERNNLWELNCALENGGMNLTLIALWDGKGGDGPGGTEHMVKEANQRGAKVILLGINKIQESIPMNN
jgi:Tetratricopeptide Repeats-Sensor